MDENDSDIKQIHDDYKNLVDYMLGSFMEEMEITPDQFEMACLEGKQQRKDNPFQFHQGLFQQVCCSTALWLSFLIHVCMYFEMSVFV